MNILVPIVLVDVLGLVGGALLLWRRRDHKPSPMRDAVRLTMWASILAAVALAMTAFFLNSLFGTLRLWCHVLFCVVAPLAMARGIWWLWRPRQRKWGWALVLVGLAMEGVYLYARRVEPFALETTTHAIASPRLAGLNGTVRVVVLADLQTDDMGAYEEGALQRVDALKADLLLLAGDYIQVPTKQAYREQHALLIAALGRMKHVPKYGAYAVMGDTEHDAAMFQGTGIRMLQNETVPIEGIPLQVFGLHYDDTFRAMDNQHWARIEAFEGLTLVLGHRPDFMMGLVPDGGRTPIIGLAGHTHGGQIVVPGFGPPLTLSKLPRKYASGLNRLGESYLCVSRGVGMERMEAPRIRLFCPPEIVVLELSAAP